MISQPTARESDIKESKLNTFLMPPHPSNGQDSNRTENQLLMDIMK